MSFHIDNSTVKHISLLVIFLRKEVIQPHLPIRLPCYDFTPVIEPAFDDSFPLLSTTWPRFISLYISYYFNTRRIFFDARKLRFLATRSCSLGVRASASGIPNSHGVTGGVYKTRERIHRDILIRDY